MNDQTLDSRSSSAVASAVPGWVARLVDTSTRNPLLYLRSTKTTTLDLAKADAAAATQLLAGWAVRLTELFPEPERLKEARGPVKSIRGRARVFRDEQGVEVLHLAVGVLSWTDTGGASAAARKVRAPVLLCPVEFGGKGVDDPTIQLGEDPQVNPVLLFYLRQQYDIDLEFGPAPGGEKEEAPDTPLDVRARAVSDRVRDAAGARLPDMIFQEQLIIGLFSYEKLPMVEDLQRAGAALAGHEIIAALAKDERACDVLRSTIQDPLPSDPDGRPPREDFLVLDADSSQVQAIDAVLTGRHLVIKGPPGTGKSQTIANLIASLIGRGRRVLFVAEKSVAREEVLDRLLDTGIADLVLHLQDRRQMGKQVAQQLAHSLDEASRQPPVRDDGLDKRLADRRRTLVEYARELHKPREPWGLSIYDAQSALLGLAGYESDVRFPRSTLHALTGEVADDVDEWLRNLVDAGGLDASTQTSPWAGTRVTSAEEVQDLTEHIYSLLSEELPETGRRLRRIVEQTGLRPPASLEQWEQLLGLLEDLARLLSAHAPAVVELEESELRQLVGATASKAWRQEQGVSIGFWSRRRFVRQARELRCDGERNRTALHDGLLLVTSVWERWRAAAEVEADPRLPEELPDALVAYQSLRGRLGAISAVLATSGLERLSVDAAAEQIRRLEGDLPILQRLPKINRLTNELKSLGLGRLLEELGSRHADAEEAVSLFRWAWLRSILDSLMAGSPLATLPGQAHARAVTEFAEADRQHLRLASQRIRRRAAERLVQAMNRHPEQAGLVREQAAKQKRHRPVRELVGAARDVVLAARPCWAMSPLVVSKILPPERLFDVVIFDEASQVRPHEAITSIMRGSQVVVAGDECQLPPTAFFQRLLADEDTDALTASDDYESILDILRTLLPVQTLDWHYRSADERLIAFSNVEIYDSKLVTFPSVLAETPLRHVLVENGVATIGQDGSAPAEVDAVVQEAVRHAEQHPEEDLGIIAFGDKHAQRIERKLRAVIADRPDIQGFFSEQKVDGRRPYFVKNLETVQGDQRAAIILSIGYGKTASGKLSYNFGPINREGGERRLNVAVTRARRRLTVVSSFSSAELDPRKLNRRGPQLLRSFLQYVESGGERYDRGPNREIELNPFELSIYRALEDAGILVTPQYGVSEYRLDFAAAHSPEQPGRMVLAIEADGATYHAGRSARDRDRLREEHLTLLGWKFHRIWSTDWFRDPQSEVDKAVAAWKEAVKAADQEAQNAPRPKPIQVVQDKEWVPPRRRLPRPHLPKHKSITLYTDQEFDDLVRWVMSDELPRDDEKLRRLAFAELPFQKLGSAIRARLDAAIERTRPPDRGE
ncbi:MAG: AAA domain-containing protein [Egibacteraceae bacterium]